MVTSPGKNTGGEIGASGMGLVSIYGEGSTGAMGKFWFGGNIWLEKSFCEENDEGWWVYVYGVVICPGGGRIGGGNTDWYAAVFSDISDWDGVSSCDTGLFATKFWLEVIPFSVFSSTCKPFITGADFREIPGFVLSSAFFKKFPFEGWRPESSSEFDLACDCEVKSDWDTCGEEVAGNFVLLLGTNGSVFCICVVSNCAD